MIKSVWKFINIIAISHKRGMEQAEIIDTFWTYQMAPLIINNDEVQGETFPPGQIFVFGGFALRANSLGHLEQIESYAPGHQVRFGSLNCSADIRGDLIFNGFEPQPSAPHCLVGHDLALPPNSALEAANTPALTLNSEPAVPIEDERLDVTLGAAISK